MDDIIKRIDTIKNIIKTLADLLKDLDEQREEDKKELEKRVAALEYAITRVGEKNC